MMQVSIDLVLIVINLLALAFSYGRFSEKITSIEKKIDSISKDVKDGTAQFYSVKEGTRLESKVEAAWVALDHVKEQMIPDLHTVIINTLKEHQKSCNGYQPK